MASHGIPRVSEAEPRDEKARQKELEDIKTYRSLVDLVEQKVKETNTQTDESNEGRDSDPSALELTSKLLTRNPEYYTIWNHRRRLLQARLRSLSAPEVAELLKADLAFLAPLLRKFPKCYWMWNHRQWLLQRATALLPAEQARRFWLHELDLATHMLARDSRNFHGWGYRRAVVAALEGPELSPSASADAASWTRREFDYTTRMISSNLSNFSAWHRRSKLIPRLLEERGATKSERSEMLDEELTLIQEALYTDPYDQSIWFYHAYLITAFSASQAAGSLVPDLTLEERSDYLDSEISKINELLEVTDDCKWVFLSLIDMSMLCRQEAQRWPNGVDPGKLQAWMGELERLDPLRSGRWQDLRRKIESAIK